MLTTERKALLMERLRREGRIVAKAIAEEFMLSEDTIRRDLRELAAEGLLNRVHGGALPISPDLPDFASRTRIEADEKQRLASAAIGLIAPGQMLFLDGGTTNAALARQLPRHFSFTVVTHSPTIAVELEHHPTVEVVLLGGRLYKHSMVAVGSVTAEAISRLRPDLFFLGATAAHPVTGFSTGDIEEASIKRQIVQQAATTWILLTSNKLDAASPATVVGCDQVTGMVVSEGVEASRLSGFEARGVRVLRA
jgi:DeoR/GlpR family transcriptional regulator of sugar metabolism